MPCLVSVRFLALCSPDVSQVIVLCHEDARAEEWMPYFSARLHPARPIWFLGRASRRPPLCAPKSAVFHWFQDRCSQCKILISPHSPCRAHVSSVVVILGLFFIFVRSGASRPGESSLRVSLYIFCTPSPHSFAHSLQPQLLIGSFPCASIASSLQAADETGCDHAIF